MCGGGPDAPNQSPIDFKSSKNTYPTFDTQIDNPFVNYADQTAELSLFWEGHFQEAFMTPDQNLFQSTIAAEIFGDK